MSQDYDDYDDQDREGREEYGEEDEAVARAKQRTSVPGIFLIILGVLNLLGAGYLLFNGILTLTPAGHQMAKFQVEQSPEQKKQFDQLGWDMDNFIRGVAVGELIVAGCGLVIAIMTIAAGARMRALRGYGLAVISSVLVCIPLISCPGCCLIGQIFGIWALIVLLSPDVKSAFR